MIHHRVAVTLECAGNGRTGFKRAARGELRWGNGAVGTAVWTGVQLGRILERAGILEGANQVVVEGSDSGPEPGTKKTINFVRSLPLAKALDEDTIIALTMNSEPLSHRCGFPARLIVPGWYGMASVKWVKKIRVISGEPFRAFFNGKKYVYVTEKTEIPVTDIRVKSIVTSPMDKDVVQRGKPVVIFGKAWSGAGKIKHVEVSIGSHWTKVQIEQTRGRYAWATWRTVWTPGKLDDVTISVRAVDEKGNAQPDEPELNRWQYGYNALHTICVRVRG